MEVMRPLMIPSFTVTSHWADLFQQSLMTSVLINVIPESVLLVATILNNLFLMTPYQTVQDKM